MNQTEFGNKLAGIRKAKGLTQSELAEKCDVSYRTIQRIEAGKVTPRGFTIKTLSAALDFDFLKAFSDNLSKNDETGSHKFITVQQIIKQTIDLFNLKTNAMKKLSVLTVISALVAIGLFTFSNKSIAQENFKLTNFLTIESSKSISQEEAIKIIGHIDKKVGYHKQSLDLIETYAEKSDYNYDTYVYLAKLVGSFGYSTLPVMDIANAAFMTHKNCDLFNDIASLIFLNNGNNCMAYVELAKQAKVAKTEDEINRIRKVIEEYKAKAQFKTLDEAFKNQ